jgi:hypothetical protein
LNNRPLRVTVSGSFNQFIKEVAEAVESFKAMRVEVLSPREPYIAESVDGFLFVESDPTRSIQATQNNHMRSIARSDFLWLVNPGGYVGLSASMEIGFAVAVGTPIMTLTEPLDLTLRYYVEVVPSMKSAVEMAARSA